MAPFPSAQALVEKTFNKVPLGQLPSWAQKHTTAQDLLVLEASGNSFQIVRTLAALGRKALRGLLIEAAQALLRSKHPLAKWGHKLLRRKGSVNLAAGAVARKLAVAVWYLMMGR